MRIQVFLFLHFYLLYLLLNSCDGYDTFWRQSMLVKQSSSFSRKHRILSLQICVHQTIGLTTEFGDWCRNVGTLSKTPVRDTSDLKQRLINTWAAYHKTSSIKQLTNGESGYVHHKGERTSLWTSAKLKPAFLEPTHYTTGCFQRHQQSTEEKANKVSKSEGIRNVEYAYHFWKCADAIYQKLSKLVHACRNYSSIKLVRFFATQCRISWHSDWPLFFRTYQQVCPTVLNSASFRQIQPTTNVSHTVLRHRLYVNHLDLQGCSKMRPIFRLLACLERHKSICVIYSN